MTQLVALGRNLVSDSEDDVRSDSSEMGDFIEHGYELLFNPDTSWCRMRYSTKQVKDSGIFTI